MISIDDFNAAYNKLIEADNEFSEDRSLKMEKDSWAGEIYFTAYIASNSLMRNKTIISDNFPTPMRAVEDVIREMSELRKKWGK